MIRPCLQLLAILNVLCQLLAGTIYFYFPQSRTPHVCTGGVAALQELHQTLFKLNFETKFHRMADCYSEFVGVNLSDFNISIKHNDIIIVPESCDAEYDNFRSKFKEHNISGRIFIFSLAAVLTRLPEYNVPYPKLLRVINSGGSIPIIANSQYIRGYHSLYSSSSNVIPSSLQKIFSDTTEIDSLVYSRSKNRTVPLIIIDDDFLRGIHPLQHIMAEEKYAVSILKGYYDMLQLYTLGGLDSNALIDVYKSGSIILDGYVPGFERTAQEAALYGAIPILNAKLNSLNSADFNIPRDLIVDFQNTSALDAIILKVLLDYDNYFKMLAPFREKIRMLPTLHREAADRVFLSHLTTIFIDISDISDGEWKVFPFLFSILFYNPLTSITVVVRHLPEFISSHGMLIEALMDQGLTTMEGGELFNSVRFHEFSPMAENVCGKLIDITGGVSCNRTVAEEFSKLYKQASLHSKNTTQPHGEVIVLTDVSTELKTIPIRNFMKIVNASINDSISIVGYYRFIQSSGAENFVFMFLNTHFECISSIKDLNNSDYLSNVVYCVECYPIRYIQIEETQESRKCDDEYTCDSQIEQDDRFMHQSDKKSKEMKDGLLWKKLEMFLDITS